MKTLKKIITIPVRLFNQTGVDLWEAFVFLGFLYFIVIILLSLFFPAAFLRNN